VGIFIYIYNVLKKIDLIKLIFIYIKRLNNKQQINMTEQLDDNGHDNDDDNDTTDYDSDDSYDSDYYEELIYDYHESSATKYNIVLCELYNSKLHGSTNNNDVNNNYLLINRIKKLDISFINSLTKTLNKDYIERQEQIIPHKFIKNYKNIITRPNYIKPEIGEVIHLPYGHTVCIIKTIWIKLIQRAWKKVYNIRMQMFKRRCQMNSLKHREVTGRWPENCRYFPSLQGLLLTKWQS
jgi:hypothetical protein